MKVSKVGFFGLVLGGVLLLGSEVHAIPVQYFTTGEFSGGNNVLGPGDTYQSPDGVVIQYLPNTVTSYDLDFGVPSFADFGTFNVLASPTGFADVDADFLLTIIQADPTFGTTEFVGTLAGRLRIGSSGAFVEFEQPLLQTIGLVIYEIVENDQGVPGRAVLVPASFNVFGEVVPGVTSIEAQITVIPEPSAVVLVSMGALAPLGLMVRRRLGKARTAA